MGATRPPVLRPICVQSHCPQTPLLLLPWLLLLRYAGAWCNIVDASVQSSKECGGDLVKAEADFFDKYWKVRNIKVWEGKAWLWW